MTQPKSWTELQAGIECLTQLLLLVDSMANAADDDAEYNDAAEILQQQIIYNGEVLDISVEALRSYKEGVQTLKYLDSSVQLGYSLLRMLEKWSKARGNGEMYMRKKSKGQRKKAKSTYDSSTHSTFHSHLLLDGEQDGEQEENGEQSEDKMIQETMFTFDAFEAVS